MSSGTVGSSTRVRCVITLKKGLGLSFNELEDEGEDEREQTGGYVLT